MLPVLLVDEVSLANRREKDALASANPGQVVSRVTQPLLTEIEHLENKTKKLEGMAKACDLTCPAHISDYKLAGECKVLAVCWRKALLPLASPWICSAAGARRPHGTGGTATWPRCCPSFPLARTSHGLPPGAPG